MRFFVPAVKDETQAEEVWVSIKKFAEEMLGWEISERRIFSIAYQHQDKDYHVEVGKPDSRNNELVIAILESKTYLVCTPNRGVVRGIPILVGQDKVERTTDFQVN